MRCTRRVHEASFGSSASNGGAFGHVVPEAGAAGGVGVGVDVGALPTGGGSAFGGVAGAAGSVLTGSPQAAMLMASATSILFMHLSSR